MKALELRIPPPVILLLFALLLAGLRRILPATPFPGDQVLGLVLVVGGIGIALAGVLQFRRARTTIHPLHPQQTRTVVTEGIYRHTRNPMYLGMAAALAGLCLSLSQPAGLVLVPLFCKVLSLLQIQPEERLLLGKFGDGYRDYMARVRRWL